MLAKAKEDEGTWGAREATMSRCGFGGVLKISKWSGINTEFVKWVVNNFKRETVPQIRVTNTKVLKLTGEDVPRIYHLPRGHMRINLTKCSDEDIRKFMAELDIPGIKKTVHFTVLEEKLKSLENPTTWAKAAILYIAYYLLNLKNNINVSLRYACILHNVKSTNQYYCCRHVLDNLREGMRENNKLNLIRDMLFVLINYLERVGKKCRMLSGNYTSPFLRDWDEIKVTKAMEQVEEIFGFSKSIAVGITKERKSNDERVLLTFDPETCPMDKRFYNENIRLLSTLVEKYNHHPCSSSRAK
ncbi:hypothetical protein LIER_09491 [Lithospermum erythrorhizon]|uniref:Uncharacterized protein n=1 Tax=Lithospermum erythrorhizon TaxID=34254 RepID=A0AAV3PJQ6_LITER